jgi:glycosyltransferase involved in cell wall biosynthesis
MRIAIDYTAAARQGAGIGRYARELVSAIVASHKEEEHELLLMAASAGLGERWEREQERLRNLAPYPEQLTLRSLPVTDDWMARIWQRARVPLPAEIILGDVDAFYSPDFVLPPLRKRTHALLTVHDLSFLRFPETFTPALRRYLERAVPRSIARADRILADSNATRDDLIQLLDVPPERIVTLYSGVSRRFSPQSEPEERHALQERYGIGERPYILSVGTIQPRKNYARLIEACAPLAEEQQIELVLVGQPAWLAEPILAAAAERSCVKLPGFVDDADLPALYRQAEILAFPSLYEGFGLPALEAMACGTPVVASSTSSLPEVVGDAGLLVAPTDVPAWTAALRRLLDDESLRARLRAEGQAQATRFTWESAAERWWEIVGSLA